MRSLLLLLLSTAVAFGEPKPAGGKAAHVVLIVWDGLRPEFVTEANSPVLWNLARRGVTFCNHHSVYPSLTNVNSTALATGVGPARSGLVANYEYRPELENTKFIRTDHPSVVGKADELTGGRFLRMPTIAELVQAAGGRTAIAGGKTTSLLHDRQTFDSAKTSRGSVTIFSGETRPDSALAPMVKLLGPFPDLNRIPGAAGDVWTTRALTEVLWADGVPRYSVLWLSEPDRTQHATGPGTEASLAAIKSSDRNLETVLQVLEKKGVREKTDIFVVSDHGFSTIQRAIDLRGLLKEAGFTVIIDGDSPTKRGEVRVIGNGGSVLFYITEHDPKTAGRLVEWLQQSDFAGVIFSRMEIEGTFPLTQMHLDSSSAPDIMLSFRWNEQPNASGVPGMIAAFGAVEVGTGTHGTLSKFDLHTTLIAVGPDFRQGSTGDLPTSNLDVAATIQHLLGIRPPEHLDGRVLYEAMMTTDRDPGAKGAQASSLQAESSTLEARRSFPSGVWRQHLRISQVGDAVYVDEGNGEWQAK